MVEKEIMEYTKLHCTHSKYIYKCVKSDRKFKYNYLEQYLSHTNIYFFIYTVVVTFIPRCIYF